ncbi:hypothetical protein AR457_36750 [Streptomyces agglomeratus]|uniref:Uncharacterized protein n=1 Tax=Streptomyces agglomeratus TaxID=285458 RepID=A0A1E5NYI6_9ACTN|nr:hypothetical protein [Streptomyces agglomeratus]OEJ21383.1 hypothetical protein AS594_38020 [Streptomyces agglomeratus]OEJ22808.1 hypothetical protein AR457_36750 [Streptomyces agglomeratus]OEJ36762.1 hypothetical protein BGK72_37155 [Streptomyces agglomeratus]OEJ56481.1 hypothetical protein BGM19_38085 [Streptomyces agglomeratus]
MRKLQSVIVVGAAIIGSVGSLSGATAFASERGSDLDIEQGIECRSHDMNIEVIGSVGALTGLAGNLLNGEGSPGAQKNHLGSDMGCNSQAL